MNRYGSQAQKHWKRWLPSRYARLEDPDSFFSKLGDEIEMRVEELSTAAAGDDPAGETYLQKLGRLNMARLNAESEALQELALLPPEGSETSLPKPQA